MKIIVKEATYQEEIKHSKFITVLIPVKSKEEVKECLRKVKENYPKATHYCYAFRLEQDKGMSDDGEPAKTAGAPMLTVLEKQSLINILAVTVRYFGGVKLGTGSLIKAYTGGVQKALANANKEEVEEGYEVAISCSYQEEKQVGKALQGIYIKKKYYDEKCHFLCQGKKEEFESLKPFLTTDLIPTLIPKK